MNGVSSTSVEVNGHRCRIWRKGEGRGPKVGFLAGFGGLPQWIPFLDALAEEREVIVPSLPGFPGGLGHHDLDNHLDWLVATREVFVQAGLEGADLVGSSVGGGLAAELAALWPGSVRRLALIAPFGIFDPAAGLADPWAQRPDTYPALLCRNPQLFADLRKAPAELEDKVTWSVEQIRAIEASARIYFPLGDTGLAKRLGRILAPTLLLWGESDRMLPVRHAEAFLSRLRTAKELRVIREAGHLAELDQPRESAAAILEWLRPTG